MQKRRIILAILLCVLCLLPCLSFSEAETEEVPEWAQLEIRAVFLLPEFTEITAVPVQEEGHVYWLEIPREYSGTPVTLLLSSPNIPYTFSPESGSLVTLVPVKATITPENVLTIVAETENAVDTFHVIASCQPAPDEPFSLPLPEEIAESVSESENTDTQETLPAPAPNLEYLTVVDGQPDSAENELITAGAATIDILWLDEDEETVAHKTLTIPAGTTDLISFDMLEDIRYSCLSEDTVTVTVDETGIAVPSSVVFICEEINVTVPYTVNCIDAEGNILLTLPRSLDPGSQESVEPPEVEGYLPLPATEAITVRADVMGNVIPSPVVFTYAARPTTISFPVYYMLGDETIAQELIKLPMDAESNIVPDPEILGSLDVRGDSSIHISVDAQGNVTPSSHTFVLYQPVTVPVLYLDYQTSSVVAPEKTLKLDNGTFSIEPDTSVLPDDYVLMNTASVSVSVRDGIAVPAQVIFLCQSTNAETAPLLTTVTAVSQEEEAPTAEEETASPFTTVEAYWVDASQQVLFSERIELAPGESIDIPASDWSSSRYTVVSDPSVTVAVDEEGNATPDEVIFQMQLHSLVPVSYLADDGSVLRTDTVSIAAQTEQTFTPEIFDGYESYDPSESITVTVDENGNASPNSIIFLYQVMNYPTVTVTYLDAQTMEPVASEEVLPVKAAAMEVIAQPDDLEQGYTLKGNRNAIVTVDNGVVTPATVTFLYESEEQETEEDILSLPDEGHAEAETIKSAEEKPEEDVQLDASEVVEEATQGSQEETEESSLTPDVDDVTEPYSDETETDAHERWATTAMSNVNLRRGPSLKEKLVEQVNRSGSYLWILSEEKATDGTIWYKVLYNGNEAYVRSDLVQVLDRDASDAYQLSLPTPVATSTPAPTAVPTPTWTPTPTIPPTLTPTVEPTATATVEPTATPTSEPTTTPTIEPTATATSEPTATPTAEPTAAPTSEPTATPTAEPTAAPTSEPTATPTVEPTATPTAEPTATPTVEPTAAPTAEPTATPTVEPTATPTAEPTVTPTVEPTATATVEPTAAPTSEPTATPTAEPTATSTAEPTATPTVEPTATATVEPTATPTSEPTTTPTVEPTAAPTAEPTATSTVEPTATPSINYRGYAITTDRTVLRNEPAVNDQSIDLLLAPETLLTISDQLLDENGVVWSKVATAYQQTGYIVDSALEHISAVNAAKYQPAQTSYPANEQTASEPDPVTGYALILQDSTLLKSQPNEHGINLAQISKNTVVHVDGQTYPDDGWAWHAVSFNGLTGYLRSDALRLMSANEEEAYLASLQSTTAPFITQTPTKAPTEVPVQTEPVQAPVGNTYSSEASTATPAATATVTATAAPTSTVEAAAPTMPSLPTVEPEEQPASKLSSLLLIAAAALVVLAVVLTIVIRLVRKKRMDEAERIDAERRLEAQKLSATWSARKAPEKPKLNE